MNESAEITIKELSDMAVGSYLLADFLWLRCDSWGGQYAEYC